ncbi:SDR family oxidoreductase [Aeromicrobium ginsengisoli]|uniref:NAD(P)H-binding protein n=1 Tax=Aeromicrobium ginsengisoli TaxID=363867 RepID=A0A5M4FI97_9ACTN|nr:NAD(P)H-binding protein [Aeromicrobium ginsengisoli]KAA1399949.1 NAD(P)H-binding protein [Aeromicrobium ginsengisoli]
MRIAVAGSTGLVGRNVVAAATAAGHEVVGLARENGIDLTSPDGLAERLAGVDAVIDVTASPGIEGDAARTFFTTVARNLGEAATAAGVSRSVVLSIIGVDAMPDYGYYEAKLAQEQAVIEHAPGPRILRAAQFLNFPAQMLEWSRQGDVVTLPEMKTQPVAVEEIARLLLALADGTETRTHVELAGPKPEELADLVRQVAAHRGVDVKIETRVESQAMADGACLPGPDAVIAGPDFATWLAEQD